MKRTIAIILMILVASNLCDIAAQSAKRSTIKSSTNSMTTPNLNQTFNQYYEDYLRLFPLEATGIADHRYDDQLPNTISDEHRKKQRDFYQKYLTEITHFDATKLSEQERLSHQIFKRSLENRLTALSFDDHLIPLNQFYSLPSSFAQLGSGKGLHPFRTVKDYENFLARIKGLEEWTDSAIANMRKGMAGGAVLPRILAERVLAQLQALIVKDARQTLFYQPIANLPASFSKDDRERLTASYTQAIEKRIMPAYQKLADFIQHDYLPKCRESAGISEIPGGKEYYQHLIEQYTTTKMTPEEIFQVGMAEVKRIRTEMEKVKDQVGFKGDLKAFFEHTRNGEQFYPFSTDEEVLKAFREIEQRIKPNLPKFFSVIPKSQFEVRLTEKFRAATASAEYQRGAPDGSRPGVFYVPVVDAKKYQSTRMESLFLHEAIPGHHYQISLQQEQPELPKFRQSSRFSAYTEGWALYTESLGKELGLYTDPYQYFGMLSAEMHRAIRLVVDVGLHAKGWSREDAINFSLENEGISRQSIISEVERYMAIPGQALSYKIGQLKILALRAKAEKALGNKFDIRAFHYEVLRDGALPLDILSEKIDNWIARQK